MVDGHLDADTGVDKPDDGGGNTDEIGVAAVRGTGKSTKDKSAPSLV